MPRASRCVTIRSSLSTGSGWRAEPEVACGLAGRWPPASTISTRKRSNQSRSSRDPRRRRCTERKPPMGSFASPRSGAPPAPPAGPHTPNRVHSGIPTNTRPTTRAWTRTTRYRRSGSSARWTSLRRVGANRSGSRRSPRSSTPRRRRLARAGASNTGSTRPEVRRSCNTSSPPSGRMKRGWPGCQMPWPIPWWSLARC